MIVDSISLAQELRRRRVGRPALHSSLRGATRETWLPGDLKQAPTSLLVLAAISLARAAPESTACSEVPSDLPDPTITEERKPPKPN